MSVQTQKLHEDQTVASNVYFPINGRPIDRIIANDSLAIPDPKKAKV
jgi:hypothetical protein